VQGRRELLSRTKTLVLFFVPLCLVLCFVGKVTAPRTGRVGGHDLQHMEVDHKGPKVQGLRGSI